MTVTGLMAGIPLYLPVCRRHPRPRALSIGLCSAATGKPRWVNEGAAGTYQGSGVLGRMLESGRGRVQFDKSTGSNVYGPCGML